jgi:hypothetical protein
MIEDREDAEVGERGKANEKEGGEGCKEKVGKCTSMCMCMRA